MRACVVLVLVTEGAVAAGEPVPLTPLDLKDVAAVQPKGGDVTKPTEIKTADELARSPLFRAGAADELKKHVDFSKEKLVVFAWSGSGRDAVTGATRTADKKLLAQFLYAPGATRDLRQHFKVFVVPGDAEVKVENNPRAK
ncbi:MAG: hypothetical protein J0I06_11845 [Planctomycetes bacterium]|nr:hypothetical protein [Planctomycetota bacterium]